MFSVSPPNRSLLPGPTVGARTTSQRFLNGRDIRVPLIRLLRETPQYNSFEIVGDLRAQQARGHERLGKMGGHGLH